jgi:hypothetical protein
VVLGRFYLILTRSQDAVTFINFEGASMKENESKTSRGVTGRPIGSLSKTTLVKTREKAAMSLLESVLHNPAADPLCRVAAANSILNARREWNQFSTLMQKAVEDWQIDPKKNARAMRNLKKTAIALSIKHDLERLECGLD